MNFLLSEKFLELRRQVFHIFYALIIIFFVYYFDAFVPLFLLGLLFFGSLTIFYVNQGKKIFLISFFLDVFERKNTILGKGAFYFTLGAFLTIWLFPKKIAITSLFILGVCDSLATIYGSYFGKIKIYGNKTLEGMIVFFTSCFLILFFSLICSAILSLSEAITFIDDNLIVPLLAGFLMSL